MAQNPLATNNQAGTKAVATASTSAWGTEEVQGSDVRIPKILLMQGLSELVSEEKASMGDFVNSITGDKLGDVKTPIEFIPIHMWKDWTISEELSGKFEYKERVPFTAQNANWEREYVVDGVKHRRDLNLNFLVMLKSDVGQSGALPYVITFRRMSSNCGKDLATFLQKAAMQKKAAPYYTIKMGGKMQKNDKGSFYVPTIAGATVTPDYEAVANELYTWYQTFKAGTAKIDDSDEVQSEVVGEGAATGQFEGQF